MQKAAILRSAMCQPASATVELPCEPVIFDRNHAPVGLGEWIMDNRVTIVLLAFLIFGPASKCGAESVLQQIGEFAVPEANQGVGVDAKHFYAVDTTICQGGTPDLRNRT
jgi:hypothetical protein